MNTAAQLRSKPGPELIRADSISNRGGPRAALVVVPLLCGCRDAYARISLRRSHVVHNEGRLPRKEVEAILSRELDLDPGL